MHGREFSQAFRTVFGGLALLVTGCTGIDVIDRTATREEIDLLSSPVVALEPGDTAHVRARVLQYFEEEDGEVVVEKETPILWESSNPQVASVSPAGVITGHRDGQADVQALHGAIAGPQVKVTVKTDSTGLLVATVLINSPVRTTLVIGEKIQLTAIIKNIMGQDLGSRKLEWFSENSAIMKVTASGEAEAVGAGVVDIHAKSEGIKSNIVTFTVDGLSRVGTFVAAGGYKASGSARLQVVDNQLTLKLSDDFDTDFVLGTYIYLANSTNGATVRTSGFQVAQIFSDGAATFNITQRDPAITLGQYRYVIVLCYPASATFGFAELK